LFHVSALDQQAAAVQIPTAVLILCDFLEKRTRGAGGKQFAKAADGMWCLVVQYRSDSREPNRFTR
jgi:hypothetical protein